jgi:thiamine biosynthesis lipoprotein
MRFGIPAARQRPASGHWLAQEQAIMGTAVRVELWSRTHSAGEIAIAAVMAEMHRIDAAMSPFKPESELSRVNREAARRPVPVSDELFALLECAQAFSALSDGAFDITFAAAGRLYDYRQGIGPDDAALARARRAIGWWHLELERAARTVRFAIPGMCIDLGGFAKGHAVDNAAAILCRHGIAHAYVSAGGDSRAVGDRAGRPWSVGVRDPRCADALVAVLPLVDAAVSTSGDYERFFDAADGRCHHIIDPRSGRSPRDVRSVTIVADDGLTAEALSKSVFVLGVRRGLALVETLQGVDAIVVDADANLHHSSGLLADRPRARQ